LNAGSGLVNDAKLVTPAPKAEAVVDGGLGDDDDDDDDDDDVVVAVGFFLVALLLADDPGEKEKLLEAGEAVPRLNSAADADEAPAATTAARLEPAGLAGAAPAAVLETGAT